MRVARGAMGLKGIALLEAAKGVIVIVAGFGIAAVWHRDAQVLVEAIVSRLHMNPASHYPSVLLSLATHPDDPRLWAIGGAALIYAAMRLTEACGLWLQRAWASWLGVWSGAIYVPVELYEAVRTPTPMHVGLCLANIAIVAYLALNLARSRGKDGRPG